ncbi:hypothetical protein CONPUDRAFT_77582 [Coniophora puteana RWD-64-598 SS2]|uniref:Uncharacterized protein n=1 Tax=Coniophora puteana (strain RWD-64-598) TaxID=741705 RepID=A0A5M3M5S9_CONPW|nr:uncharacterized protein CONPUDRAFT_77582 [Coniophora puteana RWD-64-598 SS2]EIW74732.1 hypothetical protein CONPUDRAFT_77582 [Coniophora puteana RWD-64-598 SS2]
MLAEESCAPLQYFYCGLEVVAILSSELLFAMRTYILWNRHKAVLATLITLAIVQLSVVIVILGIFLAGATFISSLGPYLNLPDCILSSPPKILFGIYLVTEVSFRQRYCKLTERLVMLALMVIRMWQNSPRSALVKEMVRGGVLYYVCTVFLSLANIIVWTRGEGTGVTNTLSVQLHQRRFQSAFHTILASRLQLHLANESNIGRFYISTTTPSMGPGGGGSNPSRENHEYELDPMRVEVVA